MQIQVSNVGNTFIGNKIAYCESLNIKIAYGLIVHISYYKVAVRELETADTTGNRWS